MTFLLSKENGRVFEVQAKLLVSSYKDLFVAACSVNDSLSLENAALQLIADGYNIRSYSAGVLNRLARRVKYAETRGLTLDISVVSVRTLRRAAMSAEF